MFKTIYCSILLACVAIFAMSVAMAPAVTAPAPATAAATTASDVALPFPIDVAGGIEEFLDMTPKKYREMTGEKLSFKEVVALKLAQKKLKKEMRKAKKGKKGGTVPVSKGLFIVFAILIPIVAVIMMGLADDWDGNNWWVALLLYFLCYLPGLIYTLVKMKEYSFDD